MKRSACLFRYDNPKGNICTFVLGNGARAQHERGIEDLQKMLGIQPGDEMHYPVDLKRFTQKVPLDPKKNVCLIDVPASPRKRAFTALVVRGFYGAVKTEAKEIVRYYFDFPAGHKDPIISDGVWDDEGFAIATTDSAIAQFLRDLHSVLLGKGEALIRQGYSSWGDTLTLSLVSRLSPEIIDKVLIGKPTVEWMQANDELSTRLFANRGWLSIEVEKTFMIPSV